MKRLIAISIMLSVLLMLKVSCGGPRISAQESPNFLSNFCPNLHPYARITLGNFCIPPPEFRPPTAPLYPFPAVPLPAR